MTRCARVAIIGMPNAGKSSLVNAIVGAKIAAVHHKAQMTRKNLLGLYTEGDCQLIFVDTPGITDIDKPLNRAMKRELDQARQDADIVIALQDVMQPMVPEFEAMLARIPAEKLIAFVVNKTDIMPDKWKLAIDQLQERYGAKLRFISARDQSGIKELLAILRTHAPEGPFAFAADDLTAAPMREIAAHIVQEQVMQNLHEEIPYETAVHIESYKEEADGRARINAVIIVNKESQKGMVIGKGGLTLKRIGTAARQEIEKLTGGKVYLSLFVKVDNNWVKDERKVRTWLGSDKE
jgi:GTP-binding protein Era